MSEPNHVVVLLHGIRTHAPWAEMVKRVLESSPDIRAIPIGYGFFDVARFLVPGPWRYQAVVKVTRELHTIIRWHPKAKLSILAHSFGTYAIAHSLMDNPDIKIHRLCLCGSIIPRSFRWNRLSEQVSEIVNDCGTRDVWPLMAAGFSAGYGASGTFGFRSSLVTDRFHYLGHSEFFSKPFAKEYWLSFFSKGEIRDPEESLEQPRRSVPMWQNAIAAAKYWLLLPCALALAAFATAVLTKSPPGLNTHNLGEIDVGYTREHFRESLGQPRVASSGSFQCGPKSVDAIYERWNNHDITVQAIFVNGNAQLFTVHLDGIGESSTFNRAGVDLGFDSLEEIGNYHMGWFKIEDGRYPAYAERHYFGAQGKYHDYFYGLEQGNLFFLMEESMEQFWALAEASGNAPYTHQYVAARSVLTPNSAAISKTPLDCDDNPTDWYELVSYLVGLPPEWAESRFLEPEWTMSE